MDPFTVITGLLTILGTVTSYQTSKSTSEANYAAAVASDAMDKAQISKQEAEEASMAAQARKERIREGLVERSKIRASTANAGLAGLLPEQMMIQSLQDQGQDVATINENESRSREQHDLQRRAVSMQTAARKHNISASAPSALGLALQIGQAGMQGYSRNKELQRYRQR